MPSRWSRCAAITEADVRRAGEPDRETCATAPRTRAIDEDTLVYRIELHAVSAED